MTSLYSKKGKPRTWDLEKIKEGFDKFYTEHDRYPTAHEIDSVSYLPSSRQIQRSWGGLVSLRKILNLDIENYSTGKSRSSVATEINKRGRELEIIVRNYLQEKFGDPFVHIERPVHFSSKDRFDFYVYARPKNFAIDVFGTTDFVRLTRVMNMKETRYKKENMLKEVEKLYFIYFSDKDVDEKVQLWLKTKKNPLLKNWVLCSFEDFKSKVQDYTKYEMH